MRAGTVRDLVFVSYSHANPDWRDKVLVLLKPFVRQGQLQVWADPYIRAGDVWRRHIDDALARTSVGVVLLTPALLASDFIADVELPHLLRAARAGDLTLVVVPIEPHVKGSTRFADGDLNDFQWAWSPDEPIAELEERRRYRALVTVTNAIVESAGSRAEPASSGVEHAPRLAGSVLTASDSLGIPHGVPPLPPNHLLRTHEHDALTRAVVGDSAVVGVSASIAHVGIHGQGGLGKSVLAASIAHDDNVRRTFPDGIFWIPIGQQPRLELLQAELAAHFGECTSVEDVGAGTRLLRERLARKRCLVILDDVWQLLDAKAFDVLDVGSRLLVTTRDRSIVIALGAREMRLDVLSPGASLELMAGWAGTDVAKLPVLVSDIAKEVDYLPLGLSLVGAQVREGRSWDDLLEELRAGHLDFLDHPYGSVFRSIKTSVDALAPDEAARYAELATFPEGVPVLVQVVETLWRATSGMDPRDARVLLSRLASRNLLSLSEVVTLHDLQHDFVRLMVTDLAALHGRLVDAWRATTTPKAPPSNNPGDVWARLTELTQYPWQYLTHHLDQAGRHEELEQVLTSAEWLFLRLTRFNLPSVLADFQPVLGHAALREVRDALVLSAHVLSKDPLALLGQLRGRLLGTRHSVVQRLIESQTWDRPWRPFFRPLTRCLTAPGGPLLRTFEVHTETVAAMRLLPDGQRVLSADGSTLILWDLLSGVVLQSFAGHAGVIRALTVSSNGLWALSASDDATLKYWDLTSGALLQTFPAREDNQTTAVQLTAVALTPDEHWALSASDDQTLKIWDLTSGMPPRTLVGHTGAVRAVTVLADGQRALSASDDRTLKLWDLMSGTSVRTFEGHTGVVTAVEVLPDGQRGLSASDDGTLRLWDLTSGAVLRTFKTYTGNLTAMLPDCERRVSSSGDGTLKLLDLASGSVLQTFSGHTGKVIALEVLPDGRRAVSAGDDCTLKLWDLTSGAILKLLEDTSVVTSMSVCGEAVSLFFADHTTKRWDLTSGEVQDNGRGSTNSLMPVNAIAVSPDGRRGLSAGYDGTIKLWDLTSGMILQTLIGHTASVVAVLPDGNRAVSAGDDGTIKLWDLTSTGGSLEHLEHNENEDWVMEVAALADIQRVLSVSNAGKVGLWDLTSGALLQTFERYKERIVTVLPDGLRVVSATGDGTLKLRDLRSGEVLQTLEGHTDAVTALAVLPDGLRAVSASYDDTLKLWDLTSGVVLQSFERHEKWRRWPWSEEPFTVRPDVTGLTVSPDGRRALYLFNEGHYLRLWDLTSGEVLKTLQVWTPVRRHSSEVAVVTSVTVLPDGQRALAGSSEGKLRLWDLTSGALLQTFDGHSAAVRAVTVLPDGLRAFSAGDDRSLRVWDLTLGTQIATFYGDAAFTALSQRPDGTVVAFDFLGRLHALRFGD